jgi:hypothetical protein
VQIAFRTRPPVSRAGNLGRSLRTNRKRRRSRDRQTVESKRESRLGARIGRTGAGFARAKKPTEKSTESHLNLTARQDTRAGIGRAKIPSKIQARPLSCAVKFPCKETRRWVPATPKGGYGATGRGPSAWTAVSGYPTGAERVRDCRARCGGRRRGGRRR